MGPSPRAGQRCGRGLRTGGRTGPALPPAAPAPRVAAGRNGHRVPRRPRRSTHTDGSALVEGRRSPGRPDRDRERRVTYRRAQPEPARHQEIVTMASQARVPAPAAYEISDRVPRQALVRPYQRDPHAPLVRPLRIYTLDPSVSDRVGGVAT